MGLGRPVALTAGCELENWYSVSKGPYPVDGADRPCSMPQHNKQPSPLVVDLVRPGRFQMDDECDLHEQILHIEAHIEGSPSL